MNKVSIIIPTYNRAESLKLTLESLAMQDFDVNQYSIHIIDNGSKDHTKLVFDQFAAKYPRINNFYLYEPIPGTLAARHRGAMEADGDIFIYTDDDIDFAQGWLNSITSGFDDPTVQLIGGKSLPKYEIAPPSWLVKFWEQTQYGGSTCFFLSLLDLGNQCIDIDANYIWSLNLSIRRKAFFELEGFHPGLVPDNLQMFQGDEEAGLTMKANRNNYRAIYMPSAVVYHRIPSSRLTPQYFIRRGFSQGVTDSFTAIRLNGTATIEDQSRKSLLRFVQRPFFYLNVLFQRSFNTATRLEQKVIRAYHEGYHFHQNAVRNNDILLEWVLKNNYWDYCYPDIIK